MADRSVKVDLIANVSGYVAGMKQAAAYTTYVGSEAAIAARKLAAQRVAFEQIGRTAIAVGALAVAGIALAVSKFSEFDAAMSQVNAVTQETAENMDKLRDAALDAGGRTIFTATEAAHAIEELGKAGLSTSDILGGALDGALDLAASGQLEVARAAEVTATTLKQFGLEGEDAAHVADVLSAGAGKALGSVEDLAQGLKFVGPVAASMGVSLEETTGALALFADQGIIGEQAGTSLRGVLASLTSPSEQAGAEIKRLGINLYNSQGRFLGLENVAGQLSKAFSNMDDKSRDAALGVIFGNQQVTAARVLFEQGGAAIAKYTDEVNDAGYAARVAADRLDNLRGDLEKLGGAFDTVLIKQGSGANDVLRSLVQSLTFLVDAAGDLPPVAVNIGLVAAAVGLAGGAALLGVGKFAEFKAAMATAGIAARSTALAVGGITIALTAVTFIIGSFISRAADAAASADAFKESLDGTSGALTKYSRDLVIKRLQETGAFDKAKQLGISQRELTDAVIEGGAALEEYSRQLAAPDASIYNPFDRTRSSLYDVRQEIDSGVESWKNEQAANEDAARAADANADALAVLEGQAGDTAGAIDDLSAQILNFGKATLDTREAERRFQAAIDDLTESVSENGQTLDVNTEAGRANESALDDLAEASLKRASAILLETGSQEEATQAVKDGRDALINALAAFGITGDAAEEYADMLGLIPSNINTALTINTSQAFAELTALQQKLAGNKAALDSLNNWRPSNFSYLPKRASGGILPGPPSRSDNMLIAAASGEYVTNAAASSIPANRAALEYMNSGGNIANYGSGYMAAPSPVAASAAGPATAYLDPATARAIRDLATAHRAVLDTVGLSDAVAMGSAKSSALGAR